MFFRFLCLFVLLLLYIYLFIIFFYINDSLPQIKTVQFNIYAEDGQLRTSNTDLVSLEGRISPVVNSANVWYENNRVIANYSKQQGMLLGNT